MENIRAKDIAKLSAITGVSVADLTKLNSMSLLLYKPAVIDALILYDWKALKKNKRFSINHITTAIMEEYLSTPRLQRGVLFLSIYNATY